MFPLRKKNWDWVKMLSALLFCLWAIGTKAQTPKDSAAKSSTVKPVNLWGKGFFNWGDPHSPRKATVYSAIIPGMGQAYNRKYWKVPIVWAAMGGVGYYTLDNARKMRKINDTLRAFYIKHNDTLAANPLHLQTRNRYRQQRDMGILAFTALYVLQIIDATVDAHFYKLDFNQSLSASLRPSPARFLTFTWNLNGQNHTAQKFPGR